MRQDDVLNKLIAYAKGSRAMGKPASSCPTRHGVVAWPVSPD